jgi:hypothetical protein
MSIDTKDAPLSTVFKALSPEEYAEYIRMENIIANGGEFRP